MKLQSLCVFILFIVFLSLLKISLTEKMSMSTLFKSNMSGQFWLQKIYRGDDPLLMVKLSEQAMVLKHFRLNDKIIAYSQDGNKFEGRYNY